MEHLPQQQKLPKVRQPEDLVLELPQQLPQQLQPVPFRLDLPPLLQLVQMQKP